MAKLCDLAVPCDGCYAPQIITCRLSDSWSEALRMNLAQLTNSDQVDRITKESDMTPTAVRAKIATTGNRRLDVRSNSIATTPSGVALEIRLYLTTPSFPRVAQAKTSPFFFWVVEKKTHSIYLSPADETIVFQKQVFSPLK